MMLLACGWLGCCVACMLICKVHKEIKSVDRRASDLACCTMCDLDRVT